MWKVPVEVDTEGEGDAPAVSESGLQAKAGGEKCWEWDISGTQRRRWTR
jgi:hypothetical protein